MKRIKHCCYTQRCGGCHMEKCLCVFWNCKKKIKEFLQDHNQPLCEQLTDAFWIKMAYLADTFRLYNETNKRMQGPESNGM